MAKDPEKGPSWMASYGPMPKAIPGAKIVKERPRADSPVSFHKPHHYSTEYARIPGWYLEDSARDRRKDAAPQEVADRIRLGDTYVHSIQRHRLHDLEVTQVKKFAGKFFNPVAVRGIIDLEQGLTKFYVEEKDVRELESLISLSRGSDVLIGSHR
jgi:hypothetical protein